MITPENIVDAKLGGASKEEIQALQQNIGKPSSQEKNRGLDDNTEDTLFDSAGYLILLIIARDEQH